MLEQEFYYNTVFQWIIAFGILIFGTIILATLFKILSKNLDKICDQAKSAIFDILVQTIKKTKLLILVIVSLYVASMFLTLPLQVARVLYSMLIMVIFIQVGIWGSYLISELFIQYMKARDHKDEGVITGVSVISVIVRSLVWIIVILLILDNLGLDITTLLAGLGVGGIAIGLASQQILSDLFASLSIIFDKPFEKGDFIIVGDMVGVVERIGLKTTRIRSLSGEELVFSNSDLLGSRIKNFKSLARRRVVFSIGVKYSTDYEQLEKIPGYIKDIIQSIDGTEFDRSHFKAYGDFALIFETVFFVHSPDFRFYMDIQQEINLRLFRIFKENGIVFAFPTQTIHLVKDNMQTEVLD